MRLTTSLFRWGKVLWLCCVQVPCWWSCCAMRPPTTFWRVAAPTGSITLVSFWGKTCCWTASYLPLGVSQRACDSRHQAYFLAPLLGRQQSSARGVSRFQSLYFVFVLLSLFYFILFAFNYQKHKKISYLHLVYFRIVIFCPVLILLKWVPLK